MDRLGKDARFGESRVVAPQRRRRLGLVDRVPCPYRAGRQGQHARCTVGRRAHHRPDWSTSECSRLLDPAHEGSIQAGHVHAHHGAALQGMNRRRRGQEA